MLALLTAGLFGVAPALQQARGSLFRALRSGGRGMIGGGRTGLRRGLVMAEPGLSLTVLSGAGLLVRSVKKLTHTELGISGSGVLAAQITLPLRAYADSGRQRKFFRALLERVRAEPGVVAAGAADPLPLSGDGWSGSFRVSSGETVREEEDPVAEYSVVSPGFFSALGLSLHAGRVLAAEDDDHAPKVVVIDSVLAQRYWRRESPLEREILVAALGLYGVMTYCVAQRSREIGVRLALGATPGAVVKMVIREGMATVSLGLAAGLTASLLLSRVMGKLLYETGTLDPLSYLCATGLLLLVSLAACYLPAAQAARIDPLRSIGAD